MFRPMTRKAHACIDYPVALGLIVMPFVLGIGMDNAMAFALSVLAGGAALVMTLLTDHETGLLPVVPFGVHLALDGVMGAVFVSAPLVFGFTGFDAMYYLGLGAALMLMVAGHRTPVRSTCPAE